MRRITLAIVFVLAAVLSLTAYAAAKSYQFTGVVKSVDGSSFTVQKSATETWEFSTDATTKGAPKVGDKVTVQYRMVATAIDAKGGTAASGKPAAEPAAKAAPAVKKK